MAKISAKSYKVSGSRSCFFIVNRRKGFKTFSSKREAELARSYQMILADHGLAPKIHSEVGRISIKLGDKDKPTLSNWGYVVERVKTLGCSDSAGGCDCERCDDARYGFEEDMDALCDAASENCGISIGDRHIGNFGLKNGHLVVLDTGIETFQEY